MSRLDELIKELCPDGVEYIKLKEVCNFQNGFAFKSSKFKDNGLPILRIANISDNMLTPNNYVYFDVNDYPNSFEQYKVNHSDVVVAMSGATTGKIGYNYSYNTYYLNQRVGLFVPDEKKLNKRYLFHWLVGQSERILNVSAGTGAQPNLSSQKMMEFMIQLPPLQVQEEIVKILDKFTDYVTELQAELQARKLQYEYYMNDLFNIPDDGKCEYKTVGELFEIKNGLNKEKSAFGKGQPIINFTDVYKNRWLTKDSFKGLVDVNKDEIERYSAKLGDVFFTRTSETKEDIGMSSTVVEDIPNCVFSGFVLRARPTTDLLLPKFCAYYFSTHAVRRDIVRYASFTTRATTTGPKLSKIKVPILPKQEQQRIIDILDRFDVLTNDITSGLPAEIEDRQKQYEHYRDKLLTFKEKEA